MFAKLSTVVAVAFAASAVALPQAGASCTTGAAQCCQQTQSASDSPLASLLGLLGASVGPIDALLGTSCTPITVVGTGSGANCNAQPVCCTGNTFNGLVSVGCTPLNVNA